MTQPPVFSRRIALSGLAASGIAACVPIDTSPSGRLAARLRIIEAAAGGTLGVALLESGSGRVLAHRGDELFAHCSSFKLSLAAMLLHRGEAGEIDPSEHVRWSADDLMSVSPFTTRRLEEGATLLELARATQTTSDNAAANILLGRMGGPEALTEFWRSLGDPVSRLDRYEPELNHVPPGEVRDTTSPLAMVRSLENILQGDVLSSENSELLMQWMAETRTGARRVRAGLPPEWRSGDKTGTSTWPGAGAVYVDIGFADRPGGARYFFASYFRAADAQADMDPNSEAVLAQVGGVLADFATGGASGAVI